MIDERTKILLDTGANISAIIKSFAQNLKLKCHMSTDKQIDDQCIGRSKVVVTSRTTANNILGWKSVYELKVWIMPYHARLDLILGSDLKMPAGIRLDLFNVTAKLANEIAIPL